MYRLKNKKNSNSLIKISKYILRRPVRLFRRTYGFINLFITPLFYYCYSARLKELSKDSQLFFLTRQDFGTFIVLADYIRCWSTLRGDTCVVILTVDFKRAAELISIVTPKTTIILPLKKLITFLVMLYGQYNVQYKTISRVYAQLAAERPDALFIFEQQMNVGSGILSTNYVKFFDCALTPILEKSIKEIRPFYTTYLKVRKVLDYRLERMIDYLNLSYTNDQKPHLEKETKALNILRKNLHINNNFIVMNVNRKDYFNNNVPSVLTRKGVQYPERYNVLIDYLIERGYTVVLQGRKEQPIFKARKGLIDYSKSPYCSIANDLALYSGCDFVISSKTGPENFSALYGVPMLGLNYTELCSMAGNLKFRFYPKGIRNMKTDRKLSWKELLQSPAFFDISSFAFLEDIEYTDMSESEMLEAVDEFLPYVDKTKEEWLKYSFLQQEFKKQLTPLHLDLHYIKGVPCESYLVKNL